MLLGIALPIMLSEAADSILWITDTFFVSRLGNEAVAAVGLGGYLSWLVFAISTIVFMGTMILVAQAWGAGERNKAEEALGEAISLALIIGSLVLLIFWILTQALVSLLAGPRVSAETKRLAIQYFRARLLSAPFSYAGVTVDSVFRATGRTRPIIVSSLAYTIMNLVLDPVLIFGLLGAPRLGVVGAGIASSIANVAFLLSTIALVPRIGLKPRPRVPVRHSRTILSLGVPAMAERIVVVGGHLFYLGIVARCGDPALTAHTIGVRVESLAFLPLFSLADATAALTGQAVGESRLDKAKEIVLSGTILNSIIGIIIGIILVILSPILPGLFTDSPLVKRLASLYLIIASISEPLFGAAMATLMGIRGAGNTLVPLAINLASYYATRGILAPILANLAPRPYCVALVWITMIYDYAARTLASLVIARKWFYRVAKRLL